MRRILTILKDWISYIQRVPANLGIIRNQNVVRDYNLMCKNNGMFDSIQFAWLGEAGSSFRTSGIYTYFTKLFSIFGTKDAVQATSTSQPYLTGNIAPNERLGMKNPNGGANYMTHPTISFGAGDKWSVTTVINWNGMNGTTASICGSALSSSIRLLNSSINIIRIINESGTGVSLTGDINILLGKGSVLTLVAGGNGVCYIYINGVLYGQIENSTNLSFNQILRGRGTEYFCGNVSSHIIRSQSLSPQQVKAESDYLRSIYPEVPSVAIGTQTWATSNVEQVCNAAGTLIPDGTVTGTWTGGTAFWCHHTDIPTGAVFGKLYNKAGRNVIIASPPAGWHVATEAENTALAALDPLTLKMSSLNWWATNNGTNATGFTAVGGGMRNADGSFSTIKGDAYFWCADSDKVLHITDAGVSTIEAIADVKCGYSIRLIKD